jgi:hypothetical protein
MKELDDSPPTTEVTNRLGRLARPFLCAFCGKIGDFPF